MAEHHAALARGHRGHHPSAEGPVLRTANREASLPDVRGNRADVETLRGKDGQIVNIKLAHGEALPRCGETVVAAGQPETDLFRINLTAARWKTAADAPRAKTEESAASVSTAFWDNNGLKSINGQIHGALLRVRGIVRTLPATDNTNDLRFTLDTGDMSFSVDVTSNPEIIDTLQIGCTVQVIGRCILLTDDGRQNYGSAKIKGIALIARSPADVVVLNRPSWWTMTRLTVVISLLLAALVGVYIWNRVLQNLVNRRGRELYREQVAHAVAEFKTDERTRLAVELHDSLSQALSGVACHMAVGAEAFDTDPKTARHYLATARKMLNACRTELRQCLFDLRSDTLEEKDFSEAIRGVNTYRTTDGREVEIDVAADRAWENQAGDVIGTGGAFEPGYDFDALVIDDAVLYPSEYSLLHRLERFIYVGDDRQIVHRFCRGKEVAEPKLI